ncbi:MAG TPA: cyclase family protein [Gaiellaceae bacterium]|nr:cyclase family protein [Gaiellaceae bacterium]
MIPGGRLVDLTLPLAETLPCSWPGAVPYRHTVFDWFESRETELGPLVSRGPFHTRWLTLAEHSGTHFDAPTHWVPPPGSGLPGAGPAGAISVDRVPLEQLIGPASVVDVTDTVDRAEPGRSPRIEVAALERFEDEHGRFEPEEVVLLRTGWDSRYVEGPAGRGYLVDCVGGRVPAWPAPTPEAVELLVERGVRCLGTDTPSVGAAENGYPAHFAGLSHGMAYVEGLARLAELPVRGATFAFFPVLLRGGSGAPGRAVAFLDG